MEKKDMIISEYSAYTFEDMEAEEKTQMAKANNANLSPAIRRDALDRLEAIEVVKTVFMEIAKKGISPLGMRFDAAFYIAYGKTLDSMKTPSVISSTANGISSVASGFVSVTDKAVDVAWEKSRVGLNKFATWLATKTK